MYKLEYPGNKKILYVKFSDKVLTGEFIGLCEEIYKNHHTKENLCVLLDLTKAEVNIDYNVVAIDMYEVKKIVKAYLNSYGGVYTAAVADESVAQMLIHFYKTLASDLKNYDFRTFITLEDARKWLIQNY